MNNYRRNMLGTLDFTAKFPGMRKPQEFTVYPMAEATTRAKIQSDTRIGWVDLDGGVVSLSQPHASGAFHHHLAEARPVLTLDGETLLTLKAQIAATSAKRAGVSFITCDNGAAINVLGV
jgi:hypothetical protein